MRLPKPSLAYLFLVRSVSAHQLHIAVYVVAPLLTFLFPVGLWMPGKYTYPLWAKLVSLLAALCSAGWATFGLLLYTRSGHFTRQAYEYCIASKSLFAGITSGLIFSVVLLRLCGHGETETDLTKR